MNHSVFRMTLDIHDAASQTAIVIKNEDTVRRLSITLSDGGRPYTISEECTAVFTARKPDGHIVFNDCQIDGNTIHYDITPQTTAAIGVVPSEIRLYGADNALMTSPQFTLIVAETIYHDGIAVESATEVSALTALISDATEIIKNSGELNDEARALIMELAEIRDEVSSYSEVFVQTDEPLQAEPGALWIDPDENEVEDEAVVKVIPKLTAAQKQALCDLANAYRNGNPSFYYDYNVTHNDYANNRCWNAQSNAKNRFGLCCNTFVEMVWMGRAATDFIGKDGASYSNRITKAFDWGYMFTFPERKAIAGEAKRDESGKVTEYYNFIQPNEDDTWSYSTNSRYDSEIEDTSKYPNHQWFNSFLTTDCVALELYRMGCEIPYDELDVGDLVFTKKRWKASSEEDTFKYNIRWRNIGHVLMVLEKAADGTLTFIECSYPVDAQPILRTSTRFESKWTVARAIDVIGNVAMCARHPAAWGKDNMKGVDRIDYVPMSYCNGYSTGQAIPVNTYASGVMASTDVQEGLWYTYGNELATAKVTGNVLTWDTGSFDIKYTNAKEGE